MELKILETIMVYPSDSNLCHDQTLQLSNLDDSQNFQQTSRSIRVYRKSTSSSSPTDPFQVICSAISKALVHYYPISGAFRRNPDDLHRFELVCTGDLGVPVINATVNVTLSSVNYLDDPLSSLIEMLVPNPTDGLPPPLIVQITTFTCGGFSLGLCFHRSIIDGRGTSQFLNAVAEIARGVTELSVTPVWNRKELLGPRTPPKVEVSFDEFLKSSRKFSPNQKPDTNISRKSFFVRDENMVRFKDELLQLSGYRFTAFEALGAYIWQARVKAKRIRGDEKVKFAYTAGTKELMRLPEGYWGTTTVPVYVKLTAADLVEQPIWKTAKLIRRSKQNITEEYVRSYIDFREIHYSDVISAGNCVSSFSDWRHLGHSTVDFGWGAPVTVLPLSWDLLGSIEPCFFLPYFDLDDESNGASGFSVIVSLDEDAMSRFRSDMVRFGKQISCKL